MAEAACTCDEPELVTTKDRNMALPYISGNPYSRYCLGCGRRYFCAESFWDSSDEKYVIPNGDSEPVPVDEYDEENTFNCPKCGKLHFGQPGDCECGAEYEWD